MLAFCEAVLNSRDIKEIWDLHCREMARYGFDRLIYAFSSFRTTNNFGDLDDALILSNHSKAYLDDFLHSGKFRDAPMVNWAVDNDGAKSWRWAGERAQRTELTAAEIEVINVNNRHGVTAGYSIGFGDLSSRAHGAMGLVAQYGLSQDDVDQIWDENSRVLLTMNRLVHQRISTMPFATARRPLTNRQREVLEWVADGKTTADIAVIMGLTSSTVEKHLRLAREALDVDTTAQAVMKASLQKQIFMTAPPYRGAISP
ncbi:helix-turn-helix transcriptional regulator [Thioclava sp.]|uniref:helix-turn-helix transcriptional regulator n=1 Tax=Thioclava sp. TaxID=1933450 RepID=UPI003AA968F3